MSSTVQRVWRVRPWIRIASLVVCAIAVWIQLAWNPSRSAESEARQGWYWVIGICVLSLYLAWVPYVSVGPDDRLVMQGWTRRRSTTVDQYRAHTMSEFGLRVEFTDGRSFTTVVFQDTMVFAGEPRYFDFIECVSGVRPSPQ